MNKTYRLLKDHPYAKEGTLLQETENSAFNRTRGVHDGIIYLRHAEQTIDPKMLILILIPTEAKEEWLEAVETRWRPMPGEKMYWVTESLRTNSATVSYRDADYSLNAFRTEGQALEAAKRLQTCLEAYHAEIGE